MRASGGRYDWRCGKRYLQHVSHVSLSEADAADAVGGGCRCPLRLCCRYESLQGVASEGSRLSVCELDLPRDPETGDTGCSIDAFVHADVQSVCGLCAAETGTQSLDYGDVLYFPLSTTCIEYTVESVDNSVGFTSFVIDDSAFRVLQANGFVGSYTYKQGSQCSGAAYCAKTVRGLSGENVLVIMNEDHLWSAVNIVYEVNDCSSVLGDLFGAAPAQPPYKALVAAFLGMMAALLL